MRQGLGVVIKKTVAVSCAVAGLLFTAPAGLSAAEAAGDVAKPPADAAKPAADVARVEALFNNNCVKCHNVTDWAGGLALDTVDVAHIGDEADSAEEGEKIIAKLRAGMMPPHGKERPPRAEVLQAVDVLESKLDTAPPTKAAPPPGLHRMNRREYANAIRDLLALDIDPAVLLPVDDSSYGFDNNAGALGSSPALVGAYVSAAAQISRRALGQETEPKVAVYQAPPDYSQNRHVDGLPFGTRGGLRVQHYFPATGEYVFDWNPVRTNAGGIFGNTRGEKLQLSIDGQVVHTYDLDNDVAQNDQRESHPVRVRVPAGQRTVGLSFLSVNDVPNDDLNDHFERTTLTQNLDGFSFSPHVNAMSISGPYNATPGHATVSRARILTCQPAQAAQEQDCATRIFTQMAHKAFRRQATPADLEAIMRLYSTARSRGGSFEDGIQLGLEMILADPQFIYRSEPAPATAAQGASYPVSDLELASRLSFFLWSSIPDEELLKLAESGKLRQPGVLDQQVRRMLADSRSNELVSNFVGQWLQLRNLASAAPVADIFPDFDDNLRQDMRREVELLFRSIMDEDRSVRDLLDANYTFLNERLARHYGVRNVYGSWFRRVELPPELDMRRGLLGKGAILTVTSNADRTSTIRRGQWIDINILGVRPPDPPPNVPGLAAQDPHSGGKKLQTLRARMTEHATNPTCAACHQMMDPLGFAMESFDGVGKFRATDAGQTLDLSGWLVDGTKFTGVSELRQALLSYAPEFVQTMTTRLLTYALGRGVEYYDMPVVRSIIKDADAHNDRFSSIVLAIVHSDPFQKNQLAPAPKTTTAALSR